VPNAWATCGRSERHPEWLEPTILRWSWRASSLRR
jgi:hypothetical protein